MMNRKFTGLLIALILVISSIPTTFAVETENKSEIDNHEVSLELSMTNNEDLFFENDEVSKAKDYFSTNNSNVQDYLENGNIIVLRDVNQNFAEDLKFPMGIDANKETVSNEDLKTDKNGEVLEVEGKKIAILYYLENGIPTIHNVYVSKDTSSKDSETFFSTVYNNIKDAQMTPDTTMAKAKSSRAAYSTQHIGNYDSSYGYYDKGTLEVDYDVYTVQDYNGKDYYSIVATIHGNSGRSLNDLGQSYYDRDWQLEDLQVILESKTSHLERDDYGPTRTIGSTSYNVSIGGSFGTDVSVDGSFGAIYTISDTDIDVNSGTSKTKWDVELKKDAQKQTCTFKPGITFDYDGSASYVRIYTKTTAYVDSWNGFYSSFNISETIKCYPSHISY